MTIGITGATGQLGRLVVEGLKRKGLTEELVAIVRSGAKGRELGVAVREADYDDPATLRRALAGIDTLLLISGSEVGKRERQHRNVIEAAEEAGVKQIVYTSLLHADRSTISLAGEHVATEKALASSGIPFTLLRNGWYAENYASPIAGAVGTGTLLGSAGSGRISAATRAEYAEAAVAVLSGEGHQGKVYELAGDDAFTYADLAAEIARQTGKPVEYRDLPESEYAAALTSSGVPEAIAEMLAGWDVSTARGDLFDDSHDLSKLIGRPTTPLSSTVSDVLKSRD